ncbi:MAG: DinB family protein [Candidatus Zixiibacteriota bacterium]|nr:MAG: DinB family protein [candidate division Zixibacteria bacterium]
MPDLSTGQRLADFSRAVRESTLKRLKRVPPGKENWRVSLEAMSFADTARHLIECDQWLFKKLADKELPHSDGKAVEEIPVSRQEFEKYVADLQRLGIERAEKLAKITDDQFAEPMLDNRFGMVTLWWIIVRGNLDHEAHHRGQIAAYLRMV